jgi:hypothetical protein
VLLRSNCDQEPEGCVRDCERSLAPSECAGLHEALLACYEGTPPAEFVCSEQGFQEIARPAETVCPGERDALIECAYPRVKECLDFCRGIDALYGPDAGSETDAGAGRICPSRDIPCDSMCWLLAGLELDEPLDAGAGTSSDAESDAESGAGDDAGRNPASLGEELFACSIERADACWAGTPDDAGAPAMSANWASVLFGCARELGL